MRIGLIGLHLETAVRNPLPSTAASFRVHRGVAAAVALEADALRAELGDDPAELAPIWYARARPGGRLARADAERMLAEMRAALVAAGPLDGLLLAQHGGLRFAERVSEAGVSPEGAASDARAGGGAHDASSIDGEERVVATCREALGADVPIVACYDPHGDPGDRALVLLDGACAFRTAPHVDVVATRARATRLLMRIASGDRRPHVGMARGSLILPGAVAEGPGAGAEAFAAAARMSELPGVLDASWLPGSPWTDRPDERPGAGAGFLVVADDEHTALQAARDANAQVERNEGRFRFRDRLVAVDVAARCAADAARGVTAVDEGNSAKDPGGHAMRDRPTLPDGVAGSLEPPTLLLDAGDAIGAGAVGDRWEVALALRDAGARDVLVAGVVAPTLVARCRAAGDGATLTATSTAAAGPELRVERASIDLAAFASDGDADAPPPAPGEAALVALAGVHVLVRSTRREIADWTELERIAGPLSRWRTVVLKATRRPEGYPPDGRAWTLASPGATDHRVGVAAGVEAGVEAGAAAGVASAGTDG